MGATIITLSVEPLPGSTPDLGAVYDEAWPRLNRVLRGLNVEVP